MRKVKLNRKELYDLVWSNPLTTLAKQFEITPARIKSACKEKKIPIPEPGFWERKKYDKQIIIPELPIDNSYGVNTPIWFTPTDELSRNRIKQIRDEIEKSCKRFCIVPDNLTKADRLVIGAKNNLQTKKPYWYGREEGFVSTDSELISIFVTKKNVKRALRLSNAFIKLVRARDHTIDFENRSSKIVINGEKYDFSVREKQDRILNPDKKNEFIYKNSGLLVISVGQYSRKREFLDNKQPLEKQLSTIVAYLEYVTDEWKKEMAWHEANRKVREEEERIIKEVHDRKEKELRDFKNLLNHAKRWDQTQFLRAYINAVKEKSTLNSIIPDEHQSWIKWAQDKADWYDPLVNGIDDILTDKDKIDLS